LLKWRTVAAALLALAVVAAGCGGDSATSTTDGSVNSPDDVVFGSGELPSTMPEGFPLPSGSVIGSTMVVTKTGFTEIVARVNADESVTADYFNQNLEAAGFSIDVSEANGDAWSIEFSHGDARGTIDLSNLTTGISQAVIRYNVP
jgi:hypothetical protein